MDVVTLKEWLYLEASGYLKKSLLEVLLIGERNVCIPTFAQIDH
jgi:hypothetical protein